MKHAVCHFVHASNITGLGASQVAISLIEAMENVGKFYEILYILPSVGELSNKLVINPSRALHVKRVLPNSLSRLLECIYSKIYYPRIVAPIVLGDIPLRGCVGQVVLMHQSNLVLPSVNRYSSKSLTFRVMRTLFRINLKYIHYLVVQTDIVKKQIIESYPGLSGKVKVISMPPPTWLQPITPRRKGSYVNGLKLFYPVAGYPHKNHRMIIRTCQLPLSSKCINEIVITLDHGVFKRLGLHHDLINNVGRLSQSQCLKIYAESDALFFPSLVESYGMPLVEAMSLGMPIICSDLPYARWVCESQAVYFDPDQEASVLNAICEMQGKLSSGWRPDWKKALSKFPTSWNEVASEIFRLHESYRTI